MSKVALSNRHPEPPSSVLSPNHGIRSGAGPRALSSGARFRIQFKSDADLCSLAP